MRVSIATEASEESTAVFTVGFEDEDDQPVTPNSIKWKLTDASGVVVNSRNDVVVSPATEINIVLSGDDLVMSAGFSGDARKLYVTIYGTYNSTYGSNLPYNHQFDFPVANLVAIS